MIVEKVPGCPESISQPSFYQTYGIAVPSVNLGKLTFLRKPHATNRTRLIVADSVNFNLIAVNGTTTPPGTTVSTPTTTTAERVPTLDPTKTLCEFISLYEIRP